MVNLEEAAINALKENRQLWVLGLDFMARQVQQILVDYVRLEAAWSCSQIPLLDERMKPVLF
jgi:hypothetical protein